MRLRKDYVTTVAAEVVVFISYLLVFRVVAHQMGSTAFAEYALSRRTLSLLFPVTILGLDLAVTRYVSFAGTDEAATASYLPAALSIFVAEFVIVSGALLLLQAPFARLFFGSSSYTRLILSLPVLLLGASLQGLVYGYLRGRLRVQRANTFMALTYGALPILAVLVAPSIEAALFFTGGGWIVLSLLFLVRVRMSTHGVRASARLLARYGLPRVPGDFIQLALFSAPGILVAQASGIREAGAVAFGIAVLRMIGSLFTPVTFFVLPEASRLISGGQQARLRSGLRRLMLIVVPGLAVLTVAVEVVGRQVIGLYLGNDLISLSGLVQVTLLAAPAWGVFVLLKSVVDAHHVNPINARNSIIAFAAFGMVTVPLRLMHAPSTWLIGGFVFAVYVLAGLTVIETLMITRDRPVSVAASPSS